MSKQYQHQESASVPLGFVLLTQGPAGVLQAAQSDGSGNIKTAVTGAGSGGTSSVDESTFTAGVSAGTPIMIYDPTSGELVIAQASPGTRILQVAASVTVAPVTSNASTSTVLAVGTTSVQAIAANAGRKKLILQNAGTTQLLVLLGSGTASNSLYSLILPAGGSTRDGSSPIYVDTMWTAAVQAISSSAGGILTVTECI